MRKFKTVVGALLIGGAVAAGGTAFTAGNLMPADEQVKGYGSQTISGVTASSITYNTNVPGDTITSVTMVLDGDTTSKTIQIAFNDAAPATCSDAGTWDEVTEDSTYTCTVSQSVGSATEFALVALD